MPGYGDPQFYQAQIDFWRLDATTMTDAGIPVGDLEPIGDCMLTPGDPSPAGRTPDGDLAYPERDDETYLRLARQDAALLAHLLARDLGRTAPPRPPFRDPRDMLLSELLHAALPEVLFSASRHDEIAREAGLQAIIDGDLESLPAKIRKKDAER